MVFKGSTNDVEFKSLSCYLFPISMYKKGVRLVYIQSPYPNYLNFFYYIFCLLNNTPIQLG